MPKDDNSDLYSQMFRDAAKPDKNKSVFVQTNDDRRFVTKPDKTIKSGLPKPKYGNPPKRK